MALKDVFSLFDSKLADTFNLKAYDPAPDREKLVKRLQATKAKFLQTEPVRGRKDFSVSNNVVAFSPTLPGGSPMILSGQTTNYIPGERFPEVIDKLVAAVDAGELDKELEAASKGDSLTGSTPEMPKVRRPRAPRDPHASAKVGWTDERRARFAASIAARKAVKQQG